MDLPDRFEVIRQKTAERYRCKLSWLDTRSASQVVDLQEYILKPWRTRSILPLNPRGIRSSFIRRRRFRLGGG